MGNKSQIEEIIYWIKNWSLIASGSKVWSPYSGSEYSWLKDRGLIIVGKPGIGKSALIPLIAKELDMEFSQV